MKCGAKPATTVFTIKKNKEGEPGKARPQSFEMS
jgi:hypothetical protein